MLSKRNESFRYYFDTNLPCTFRIIAVNDVVIESVKGPGLLKNLSPSGAKFSAKLKIPTDNRKIKIELSFELVDYYFTLSALLVWHSYQGQYYEYGCDLLIEQDTKQEIIEKLKQYSKKLVSNKVRKSHRNSEEFYAACILCS